MRRRTARCSGRNATTARRTATTTPGGGGGRQRQRGGDGVLPTTARQWLRRLLHGQVCGGGRRAALGETLQRPGQWGRSSWAPAASPSAPTGWWPLPVLPSPRPRTVRLRDRRLPGDSAAGLHRLVPTGIRLRFTGVPGRSYNIERAPAVTGPWTTINTQTAPRPASSNTSTPTRPRPRLLSHERAMNREKSNKQSVPFVVRISCPAAALSQEMYDNSKTFGSSG